MDSPVIYVFFEGVTHLCESEYDRRDVLVFVVCMASTALSTPRTEGPATCLPCIARRLCLDLNRHATTRR